MKVSVSLSIISLTISAVYAETIKCKVVPFETQDGISGTCCVIFKNSQNDTFPKEEVAKQVLEKSGTEDDGPPARDKSSTDDKVVFMEEKKDDRPSMRAFMPVVPETKKNVSINTKNAFDVPRICPDGTMKDHSGSCSEPF